MNEEFINLPKCDYGPCCMMIMHKFIEHHNLPKDLPLPKTGDNTVTALGKIFNLMAYSLGDEKKNEIMKLVNEYNMSVPACMRT